MIETLFYNVDNLKDITSMTPKNDPSMQNYIKLREAITSLSNEKDSEIKRIINSLTFVNLNVLLFKCDAEENSEFNRNSSVYNIPNYGPIVFCGLQGFANVFQKVNFETDPGHPILENLRQGNWIMEYIVDRLKLYSTKPIHRPLQQLATWLDSVFRIIYTIPRQFVPTFFHNIFISLYSKVLERCFDLMNVSNNTTFKTRYAVAGPSFVQALALTSIQLVGICKSALLPNTLTNGKNNQDLSSMAAGLTHFCESWARNWGRDTFISLKGLLLLTNRHEDAKNIILTFASTLRHGLIPNLLGEGISSRYNARDAVWWWMKAIKDYTECVPNGFTILNEEVYRLYPTDATPYPANISNAPKQKLKYIIQEALTVHVNGLSFVERNAGPTIDDQMRDEGFHNSIGVDLNTGFVLGGNRYNCGTWMDKMGSSAKANNKGIPATPRDGSAVELVGLSRCVLEWLMKMNVANHYEITGVTLNDQMANKYKFKVFTWKDWASRIDANFEKFFWIDRSSTESKHINIRDIYKDTLNSTLQWSDYQLRPNFLIALCLAPQMINPEHARKALQQVKQYLMNGPNSLGIKTLSENDYNYCGTYDNANDSADQKVANGFNYHQGPEWLWPVGYFFRAMMIYSPPTQREVVIKYIKSMLTKYQDYIYVSDWKSLPELTNENGKFCPFSCTSQAWSTASLMEVCTALSNY